MFRRRAIAPTPTHEELFIQRYRWLHGWAMQLTGHDPARADDLLHDVFVQFILSRPDLQTIKNHEAYLYSMLKNIHLSQARRAAHDPERHLSLVEYDSAELGLRMIDPHTLLQAQDELRRICHYACARKETSKAGSVLILRFFHGYYSSEIAQVLGNTRQAVSKGLTLAAREAQLSLENPSALSFLSDTPRNQELVSQIGRNADELLAELRAMIFRSRQGDCLTQEGLVTIYRRSNGAQVDVKNLAHIVSCRDCLDEINRLLDLPTLCERYPQDTLGMDTRSRGGGEGSDGGPSGGAPSGGDGRSGSVAAKRYMRRVRETIEHFPKELRIAANGYVLASHKISSDIIEQELKVNVNEPVSFVEIFSEQRLRLLMFNVESPPEGPYEQRAFVDLSDYRRLEARLSFGSHWPLLSISYHDPAFLVTEFEAESADVDNVAGKESDNSNLPLADLGGLGVPRRGREQGTWVRNLLASRSISWSFWVKPGIVTAVFAVLLISLFLLLKSRTQPLNPSASDVLAEVTASEAALAARTDQVVHRIINLERRSLSRDPFGSGDDSLITRQRIEIWQNADNKITARRVYDDRGHLVGGEWTKADGSRTVYHHGSRPQNAQPIQSNKKLSPNDIWRLDLSARTFSSLVGQVEAAKVEERPGAYVINYERSTAVEPGGIARATLLISRADMHVTELTVVVDADSKQASSSPQSYEYRFVETSFERRAPNTVAPAVFEVEPELITEAGGAPTVKTDSPGVSSLPVATSVIATADLEVEVMRLLSDVSADLGEQINVTRTPEGLLKIQGIVETDNRKREILSALDPVVGNPAVRVELRTVAEALKEQREPPRDSSAQVTVEQVETATDTFPAYSDLRRHMSEEEARQFADRMVELSRRAMGHAGAMKKLAARFSPEELRTLTPEARMKWLTVIRNHARAYEQKTRMLRHEIEPIFFPAAPATEGRFEVRLAEDSDLVRDVARLFDVGLTNERVVRSAFAVSSAGAATSAFKTQSFWNLLREAEALALKIANKQ